MNAAADAADTEHRGLHAIAMFEAAKGVLALLAAAGLEWLGPAPLQRAADALLALLRLDPAHASAAWLANALNPDAVHVAAAVMALYGLVRLAEAWGLWRAKAWASWLGLSAALYLPFDVYAFALHRHWLEAVVVAINLLVVWVLARDLLRRRR
ncbi:DUF2127 domain-containing protein [Thermomonas brevis]